MLNNDIYTLYTGELLDYEEARQIYGRLVISSEAPDAIAYPGSSPY